MNCLPGVNGDTAALRSEMVKSGVGAGYCGWWHKIRATDMRDNIQNHLVRRPHQLSEWAEGVFSLLPAGAQDAHQDLLGLRAAGSAVSAPRLAGNRNCVAGCFG